MLRKIPKNWLNRNEHIIDPSPDVVRALQKFDISVADRYFDGYYGSALAPVLAKKFALSDQQISVGYGAEFFLRAFFDACDPKRDIILSNDFHYSFYSFYAKTKKIRLASFGLIDRGDRFEFDIDEALRKIKSLRPKIILLTSPNNPTGNSLSSKDLGRILRTAKKDTLVVLDQAYYGFDFGYDERAFLSLLRRHENLVILRSFSKYYALAGIRLGFALWGARAKQVVRYSDLYLGGSRLLEEIGLAALESDSYYQKRSRDLVARRSDFISTVNRSRQFKTYLSDANFVLVKVLGSKHQRQKTTLLLEKNFEKMPIVISKFVSPEFMRVSLGSAKDIPAFLAVLQKVDTKVSLYEKHSKKEKGVR